MLNLYSPTLISVQDYWTNHSVTIRTFVSKMMSQLFNMLPRFVNFSFKEKSSFNFLAAVTVHSDFGGQENKIWLFPHFPIYLPWSDGTRCHDLSFLNTEFYFSLFTLIIKSFFFSSSLSAIRVVSSESLKLLIFLPDLFISAELHPAQHFTWYSLHRS